MATRTYKSEPMAAVHELMGGFHDAGAIDQETMHEFDAACLSIEPEPEPERNAQPLGSGQAA